MYILLGVLALLILFAGIALYNSLVSKKNRIEYAFSSIDVMLKQRRDLIPNLVATAQQYMKHEESIFTKIAELRNGIQTAADQSQERFNLEGQLGAALRQFSLNVENYPDLKANTNFIQLQRSLNEVEAQIAAARRTYNSAVFEYNNAIEMFPSSIVASSMGLQREQSFEIPELERANVDVSNLFKQ